MRWIKKLAASVLRQELDALRRDSNVPKRDAVESLREELRDVALILASICSLQKEVEGDLRKALDSNRPVTFRHHYFCGSLETGRHYVDVIPDLESHGRWLKLFVASKDATVLAMVMEALREPVFFGGDDIRLEGDNRLCGSINGAHGRLVSDYLNMQGSPR